MKILQGGGGPQLYVNRTYDCGSSLLIVFINTDSCNMINIYDYLIGTFMEGFDCVLWQDVQHNGWHSAQTVGWCAAAQEMCGGQCFLHCLVWSVFSYKIVCVCVWLGGGGEGQCFHCLLWPSGKNVIREVHVRLLLCLEVSVFIVISCDCLGKCCKSDPCLAAKLLLCGMVSAFIAVCCHWQEKYESDLCFAKKATTGLG